MYGRRGCTSCGGGNRGSIYSSYSGYSAYDEPIYSRGLGSRAYSNYNSYAGRQGTGGMDDYTHRVQEFYNNRRGGYTDYSDKYKYARDYEPYSAMRSGSYTNYPGGYGKYAGAHENPSLASASEAARGRATWRQIHHRAATYAQNPSQMDMDDERAWIWDFAHNYGCVQCQRHLQQELAFDPPRVRSRDEYVVWWAKLHNKVNQRLGKPQQTLNLQELLKAGQANKHIDELPGARGYGGSSRPRWEGAMDARIANIRAELRSGYESYY